MEYVKCPNCSQFILVNKEEKESGVCPCCGEYEYRYDYDWNHMTNESNGNPSWVWTKKNVCDI